MTSNPSCTPPLQPSPNPLPRIYAKVLSNRLSIPLFRSIPTSLWVKSVALGWVQPFDLVQMPSKPSGGRRAGRVKQMTGQTDDISSTCVPALVTARSGVADDRLVLHPGWDVAFLALEPGDLADRGFDLAIPGVHGG